MEKKIPKNIYNVKKWTCLGAFRIGEIQNNDNETGLKGGKE